MSLSLPFLTKSKQVAAWQTPTQTRLTQSALTVQPSPVPHAGHEPPQSTSVSLPFSTASVHVAGWHTPAGQLRLAQSAPTSQLPKLGQGAQSGPPQSTSVSVPFLIPSVQAGAWQTLLAEQNPVVQSSPVRHA
jgi:hypothetical protein